MAEFHPIKFLVPLLEEAVSRGCQAFEGTTVSEVDEHDVTTLKTLEGRTIRTRDVVIASHFPCFDPAFYYARLDAFRDYAIAVEMPNCLPAMYVGSGEGYTYRCAGDLLIVSGGNHKVGKNPDTEAQYKNMEAYVRDHFGLSNVRYRWSSQDCSTLDQVPYVGQISANADHVWVACGFAGWGMTTSVVAARLLTSLIRGENPPEADLYSPLRFKPLTSAPTLGEIVADSVRGLVGKRLVGGHNDEPEDLKPGQAEVVNTKEGKVGAYCDDQGVVHTVSAVCTHMGCILAWNNTERSWDCPCHGSRFDHEGNVLHGPAVSPLKKVELD
jgi:Rieske Fe-S protein